MFLDSADSHYYFDAFTCDNRQMKIAEECGQVRELVIKRVQRKNLKKIARKEILNLFYHEEYVKAFIEIVKSCYRSSNLYK